METSNTTIEKRSDLILWLAFGSVYLFWGSTYLALRFVLESMPPFLMAGSRYMTAGTIMLLFAWWNKHAWPAKEELKNSVVAGFLLLVVGNGCVVWASQYISSGITALLITIEPVWVVFLLWMKSNDNRPTFSTWIGMMLGIAGMIVLVGPSSFGNVEQLNPLGVAALLLSSISWAVGSVYVLSVKLPSSSAMSTGFQMLAAGICMFLFGTIRGEWFSFEFSDFTTSSILGFLYLVIFGSLIGFSAYSYIVKKASPTSVSTYAYVNPVIAVFIGWWIGNERVSQETLIAATLLVLAVVIILAKPDWKINFNYKKIRR